MPEAVPLLLYFLHVKNYKDAFMEEMKKEYGCKTVKECIDKMNMLSDEKNGSIWLEALSKL